MPAGLEERSARCVLTIHEPGRELSLKSHRWLDRCRRQGMDTKKTLCAGDDAGIVIQPFTGHSQCAGHDAKNITRVSYSVLPAAF